MGEMVDRPKKHKELHALVTGFGTFSRVLHNPSYLIASSLPKSINGYLSDGTPLTIHLHLYPTEVRTSYDYVLKSIPQMLFKAPIKGFGNEITPSFDFVLFIGLGGGDAYRAEGQGHRDGYMIPDVDGCRGPQVEDWTWASAGAPTEIQTDFKVEPLMSSWKALAPQHLKLIPSMDAGRYLCDFIYYTGLFEYWKQAKLSESQGAKKTHKKWVLFMHTPGPDATDVHEGTDVAKALLLSMGKQVAEAERQ